MGAIVFVVVIVVSGWFVGFMLIALSFGVGARLLLASARLVSVRVGSTNRSPGTLVSGRAPGVLVGCMTSGVASGVTAGVVGRRSILSIVTA